MADFLDSEAEESGLESDEEAGQPEKKKTKRKAKVESDDEDDEDDEDRLREELKDLIDDAPLEESGSDGEDSDRSGGRERKRKQSDDELDDRLEDEDYDLIEENLGVKVERKKFKRLRRIQDDESDGEGAADQRDAIHDQLFVAGSDDEEERRSTGGGSAAPPQETVDFDEEEEESESDADDFIVDDDGQPKKKKKKRKPIFTDASLQEGQDIFGVDFDYDEFEKYEEDEYEDEEEEDEYLDEDDEEGEGRARKAKKAKARRPTKKSIFEIYEPSELKRGHFTDLDNEIRNTDVPERMQMREVPLSAPAEGELEEEAEWIYRRAFALVPLSNGGARHRRSQQSTAAIPKIKQALDFMRNQTLEVPFIAFYRKEYVQPELDIDALWKVYKYDAKWCLLRQRKQNLLLLMERMRDFQIEGLINKPDEPLPETLRILKDTDLERLRAVTTNEELADVHAHFLLHYSHHIPEMQAAYKLKEKRNRQAAKRNERLRKAAESAENEDGEEAETTLREEAEEEAEEADAPVLKHAARSGPYHMCRKVGLEKLVRKFGLTPAQFAENVHNNYQKHEVIQENGTPLEAATRWASENAAEGWAGRPADALQGAALMLSLQIAREPQLRAALRDALRERATLTVRPTRRGLVEIDESHPCYPLKYIKDKPIRDLSGDQYLKLSLARDDKLLVVSLAEEPTGPTGERVVVEMKQLFYKDEFAASVQAWNDARGQAVEMALSRVLLPELRRELHGALLEEAKEKVVASARRRLRDIIRVAPYRPSSSLSDDDDDDEWDSTRGTRVFGLSFSTDRDAAGFGAVVGPGGDVIDHLRLPAPLERPSRDDRVRSLARFISAKKPHVVVIGGESRDAIGLKSDVVEAISRLVEDENFPRIPVEIQDNRFPKVYANSVKGESDFREYPLTLREAISQARLLQDPLVELSCLCGPDDEILCLRWDSLQDQISKEELLAALQVEFINKTNEVGVDVNAAVQNNRGTELLQFVCGLGARKAQALLKLLKQTNQRLENRTQLVTLCHMGPKVFINCSGFIKIDTASLGDSTEAYVEVLDGSRVHPETYEWARKMAVDALEYEDEDANPAGALEEILEAPERLKDLDLDAFAEELERQGFGNKSITLYDIRAELNSRYRDLRSPYRSPSHDELFDILTKETLETFHVGKLILARVIGITHRKPQRDQLDQANPVRDHDTGLWQCPFCLNNEFPELSEVWNHFDAGSCPGQATGIRLRLDNDISGYIHVKNISDRHVANPAERVRIGQMIHCRILKIDTERFSVDCSSKTSDLTDANHEWRPTRDPYYDRELEEKEKRKTVDAKTTARRRQYVKRVIVHPAFRNVSFADAEKEMAAADQGEAIVRPSSKGTDRLTVTWKVADGIYQHVDVREEGKENDFSLGRSLWIAGDEFEDLDEIIARYVTPMAGHARDLLHFKYYRDFGGARDRAEEALREEKRKNANKIHYFVSAAKNYPGRFLLSYLPTSRCRHEYIGVAPDGFRFRQRSFDSLGATLRWFKEHFREPPPPAPGRPAAAEARAALAAAGRTPALSHHGLGGRTPALAPPAYMNTPYTPSAQTPYMTPYATTPRQRTAPPPRAMPPPARAPPHRAPPQTQPPPSLGMAYPSDPTAWQKAAEAWAKLKAPVAAASPSPSTPGSGMNRTPRYEDSRKTPQYSSGRQSARSTPHTNTSPRSMSLGDATPLYDEN